MDLSTQQLERLQPRVGAITPSIFQLAVSSDIPMVQGGLSLVGLQEQLWVYNTDANYWAPPQPVEVPQASLLGSAGVIDEKLYIFGGFTSTFNFNDKAETWRLDLQTSAWEFLDVGSTSPPQSGGLMSAVYHDQFWIYGGVGNKGYIQQVYPLH